MTAWPDNSLNPETDSGNYSCVSSRNEAGGPVSSTTLVAIEYPPHVVQLSETRVSVIEGQIPARVVCSTKSQPGNFKFRIIALEYYVYAILFCRSVICVEKK